MRKLARAIIALALAQAEADAQAEAESAREAIKRDTPAKEGPDAA